MDAQPTENPAPQPTNNPAPQPPPFTPQAVPVLVARYMGHLYDSNNFTFKDGQLVVNNDGTPKKRAGRKVGTKNKAKATPPPPPAPAQESAPAPAQTTQSVVAVVKEVAPPSVAVIAPPPVVVMEQSPVPVAVPVLAPVVVQVPAAVAATRPALPVTMVAAPPPQKAPKLQTEEAVVTVSRTVGKFGKTEQSQETFDVRTFVTEPSKVELGYGLTLSLGDYEFARIDVKVTVPCYREEVNLTYENARTWVQERVQAEVKEVRNATTKKPNNPF